MTENHDTKDPLDSFRLYNEKLPGSLSSDYWKCRGAYISNVCIALHLCPKTQDKERLKAELYRLLRSVWQTALLCNLTRPIIAVISSLDEQPLADCDYRDYARWATEQNWHQGHFCLYVEHLGLREGMLECPTETGKENKAVKNKGTFKAQDILLELLAQEPQEIAITEWRTYETIEEQINHECEKIDKALYQPVKALKDSLFENWNPDPKKHDEIPEELGPLQAWFDQIEQKKPGSHDD